MKTLWRDFLDEMKEGKITDIVNGSTVVFSIEDTSPALLLELFWDYLKKNGRVK